MRNTLLSLTICALIGLLGGDATSQGQITYISNEFKSDAHAETDAGPEYAYTLSETGFADASGAYQFSESGTAPGYGSSASVSVEHDSKLSAQTLRLFGKARGYVADDFGYAWCLASSSVSGRVVFQLARRTRITISGALAVGGSSPPNSAVTQVELRNSRGQLVFSRNTVGGVNFVSNLPAGRYTLTVRSAVVKEINFSGGDVYEDSDASYNLLLRAN